MAYQHLCPTCEKIFQGPKNRVYCSKPCWPSSVPIAFDEQMPKGLSTGTLGALAELAVCVDLMRRGYAVFRALSPACYCDIIARKFETVWEIEVRTGYERNGHLYTTKGHDDRVNCFALWNKEIGSVGYFHPNTFRAMTL